MYRRWFSYGSNDGLILTGENGGLEHLGYDGKRGTERHLWEQ